MQTAKAIDFIRPALGAAPGDWSDLGAGSGTFTAALAHLLGAAHTVTAVERDGRALKALQQLASYLPHDAATLRVIAADLAHPSALEAIAHESQAGVLFGNVLHYFADPLPLLLAARHRVLTDGVIVVLEYEGARANPWVPYPVSLRRLGELADAAELEAPDVVNQTTSRYQGTLYCAVLHL